MKKYFYKTNFSFLCTPIDIDFCVCVFLVVKLGGGVGRGIWTWNWCVARGWCQMLFYILLISLEISKFFEMNKSLNSTHFSLDIKIFSTSPTVCSETIPCLF